MTEAPPPVESIDPAVSGESSVRDLTTGSAGTLVLLVLVFVCYAWTSQAGYIWNDDAYVTGNTTLRDFNGLSRIWTQFGATPQYYPLTFTSFWIEFRAFGLNPKFSHVINALLHAGSVLLLWKILRRLAVPGAWMAAAVFAVHPMNVESVAWISERKNTLSMILGLSATYVYLTYAKLGVAERTTPAGEGFKVPMPDDPERLYRLFLAMFALALLAKTTLAVLPFMLLAVLWWKRGRIDFTNDVVPMLPAIGLGLAGGLLTSYLEHSPFYVGASGAEWDATVGQRAVLVGQTTLFYFWKILWPFPIGWDAAAGKPLWPFAISFNYDRWTPNPANPLHWLPLAALVVAPATLWALRGRIGRGPLAAALVFFIGLLPASGLVLAYPMRFSWVADHFAYVGQIGLIVGVVAGLAMLIGRREVLSAVLGSGMLVAMVALTFWHALSFASSRNLWERTLTQNPRSWMAAVNYGGVIMDIANAEYDRLNASADVEAAVKVRDDSRAKAELWLKASLGLNPRLYEAHGRLGELAMERGKPEDAIEHYRTAERVAGELRSVYRFVPPFRIGEVKLAQGKLDEAIAIFEGLEKQEGSSSRNVELFTQVHTRLGDAYRQQLPAQLGRELSATDREKLAAVMEQYNQAVTLAPDYVPPKIRLASLLIEGDYLPEAVQLLSDIVRLDVNNLDAKVMTARVAAKQGRLDVAVAQLDNLIQHYPDFIPAHLERAVALQVMGRPDEAKAGLRGALEKYPKAQPLRRMLNDMQGDPATNPTPTSLPMRLGPALPTPNGSEGR